MTDPTADSPNRRRHRARRRSIAATVALLASGLLSGMLAGNATATTETIKYAVSGTAYLTANTAYGIGQLTAYGNDLSCSGGPSFYGSVFKKSAGGVVSATTYGYCGSLSYRGANDFTNWWCSNQTIYNQLGSCWFVRNV